jgi:flagellar biosynthetic protein FliQ
MVMVPLDLYEIMRDALVLVMLLCLPVLSAALFAGVLAGILTHTTGMSDGVIVQISRILAVVLVLLVFLPFMGAHLSEFANRVWIMLQLVVSI